MPPVVARHLQRRAAPAPAAAGESEDEQQREPSHASAFERTAPGERRAHEPAVLADARRPRPASSPASAPCGCGRRAARRRPRPCARRCRPRRTRGSSPSPGCALEHERLRPARGAELRPVPEHRVAVLQRHGVRADRRRLAVHLEDPAGLPAAAYRADLVDVRAERGRLDVVVELARIRRSLERVERVRLARSRAAPSRRRSCASCLRRGRAPERRQPTERARVPPERRQRTCVSPNPPSARGSSWRRTAGLLTRGALPCRLPSPQASGVPARKRLPSQRRDRPGLAPAFPNRSPLCGLNLPSSGMHGLARAHALAARRRSGRR